MEAHEEFMKWAIAQGVNINGIKPHRFEGRGLGIVAERDIEAGEIILTVPIAALYHASRVPESLREALPSISVHGLLAADLSLNPHPSSAWNAVLPSFSDFTSMPLLWDSDLQALLPTRAFSLFEAQKSKLDTDWAMVCTKFPSLEYEIYLHKWLIVNTRTFYFVLPSLSKINRAKIPRECRMTLNPFADYFNHSSAGSSVAFSSSGYTITTTTEVKAGEEIYISYGNHSNDFLLVEYGFILDTNVWDEILLDEFILPMMNRRLRDMVEEAGFLGNYTLDNDTVCYRTHVALRSLVSPPRNWKRFVDGLDTGENDEGNVDELLLKILLLYKRQVAKMLEDLSEQHTITNQETDVLHRRYKQIEALLNCAASRIQS